MTAVPLSSATLADLPAGVERPGYDRSALRAGIVHVGVGGFHRAHQAMYLDRLMAQGEALDWGVVGVGLMPGDARMRDVLNAQDCLYTLVVKHPDGRLEPRVIGSIVDYLYAPDDPDAVVERMSQPDIRIVSLTVTEGGYDVGAWGGPGSTFDLLTSALQRRRARGIEPFTILSCDNLQGNGEVAREAFATYAAGADAELGTWVRENVRFPSCMVDRITPVTTDDDRAHLREQFGVADGWPVVCEPFAQWVLEDFPGRPPFEAVGVQVVDDVEPYELMKLRLLNASHQGIAYLGYLAGYRLVHDVAQDPLFARFLLAYMDDEATPSLAPVPGIDLDAYKHELIARFSNAQVRDTVARLCAESSDRIPTWVLPVIRHNLATGGPIRTATAIVAAWARYAEGVDEQGAPIEVVDRLKDRLTAAARRREDPLAFVRDREVFGDLVDDERFTSTYLGLLSSLQDKGSRATLEGLVG